MVRLCRQTKFSATIFTGSTEIDKEEHICFLFHFSSSYVKKLINFNLIKVVCVRKHNLLCALVRLLYTLMNINKRSIINFSLSAIVNILPVCHFRLKAIIKSYRRMFPSLEVDENDELEKYKKYAESIRPLVIETVSYIHSALRDGKKVLVEGANAAMLDIDFGNFDLLN